MQRTYLTRLALALLCSSLVLIACRGEEAIGPALMISEEQQITTGAEPIEPTTHELSETMLETFETQSVAALWYRPWLIVCPTVESYAATAEIGPEGGVLELHGHRIEVPPGALSENISLMLRVPASLFLRIDIKAKGRSSFQFEQPVNVTISYARCPWQFYATSFNGVWYIDSRTGALTEYLRATDDRVARTVSFVLIHLSTYAVAY